VKRLVVLVTTPGRTTSEKLSRGLVQNHLAACVNRLPGVKSRYWWKGRVETSKEELLIMRTRQDRLSKLIKWVKGNHPYAVCEIVALPIAGGNRDYLKWIEQSLR
jgi:periplasmic divalent cation tolerance protein